MSNPGAQARIAALLYLVVVVTSTFALVTSMNLVTRDVEETARNLLASETLFRLAIAANLIAAVAYTAVVAMFYRLFRPVDATLSAVAAFIGLGGCASSAALMIFQLDALVTLDPDGAMAVLGAEQTHVMARHALRLGGLGNALSLVFFGFYCLCLGALVLGARFMPRWIGVLLLLAGTGWLVGNLGALIAPDVLGPVSRMIIPVSGLGELLFALWLLVFGVSTAKWREQAAG